MIARARSLIARARAADAGSAMMEFALGLPLVLYMGGYGVELANYAYIHLRVNQITLALADNASRIGSATGQSGYNVREADLNDVLQGTRVMGQGIKLTTYGRVTLSSIENIRRAGSTSNGFSDHADDSAAVQRLHWQRCIGMRGQTTTSTVNGQAVTTTDPGYDSSYGQATPLASAATDASYANRGVEVPSGFGPAPLLNAPQASALIFVEINYQYHPLFGNLFIDGRKIHYVASFIVRDQRDFTRIYNPNSSLNTAITKNTCNLYPV